MFNSVPHHNRVSARRLAWLAAPAVAALVLGASPAAASASTSTRWVAPDGSGTACAANAPCTFQEAVDSAPEDAAIIVLPGTYQAASVETDNTVYISGAAGADHPTIQGASGDVRPLLTLGGTGSTVTDLNLVEPGDEPALQLDEAGTVEAVTARASGADACVVDAGSLVRDSVCSTNGTGAAALDARQTVDFGSKVATNLVNDTLVATGSDGIGLYSDSTITGSELDVDAQNTIVYGALSVSVDAPGDATIVANFSHSYLAGTSVLLGAGDGEINADSTDLFSGLALAHIGFDGQDLHEVAGSTTIDAGEDVADLGSVDAGDGPRTVGSNPDIGAYEFTPPTPVNPVDPMDPGSPTNPETPTSPVTPANPVDPVNPASPVDSTSPVSPADPVTPTAPQSTLDVAAPAPVTDSVTPQTPTSVAPVAPATDAHSAARAPAISRLHQSGRVVTYTSSAAGTVTFKLERVLVRTAHGKRKRTLVAVAHGTFTRAAHSGRNSVRLPQRLAAGRYVLSVRASAHGVTGTTHTLRVTVARAARRT